MRLLNDSGSLEMKLSMRFSVCRDVRLLKLSGRVESALKNPELLQVDKCVKKQNQCNENSDNDKQILELCELSKRFREREDPVVADVEGGEVGEVADAVREPYELGAREAEGLEGCEGTEISVDEGHCAAVEDEGLERGELGDFCRDVEELAVLHGEGREAGEREQGLGDVDCLDVVDLECVEPHVLFGRHEGERLCGTALDDEGLERAVVGGGQPHVAAAEPLDAEIAELAELLWAGEAEDIERGVDVAVFAGRVCVSVGGRGKGVCSPRERKKGTTNRQVMKALPSDVLTSKKTCWRRSSLKLLQKSASSVPFAVQLCVCVSSPREVVRDEKKEGKRGAAN